MPKTLVHQCSCRCPVQLLFFGFWILQLYYASGIRVIGKNSSGLLGEEAHLYCALADTASEELVRIVWRRSTREKPEVENFLSITQRGIEHLDGIQDRVTFTGNIKKNNGSILISNIKFSDDGLYTCVCNVFPSGTYQTSMNLKVLVSPTVGVGTYITPVVGSTEGTVATCSASNAYPVAEVYWHLGALAGVLHEENYTTLNSNGTYTVASKLIGVPFKELNQKTLQCVVKHASLNKELILDYTLVIHYPPQVVYIISANTKRPEEFECVADANPEPTKFTWSRQFPENQTLPSDGNGSRLIIKLISDNNGLYYCKASNQYGNAVGSLNLRVIVGYSIAAWIVLTIVIVIFVILALHLKFNIIKNCRECLSRWIPVSTNSDSPPEQQTPMQQPQELGDIE